MILIPATPTTDSTSIVVSDTSCGCTFLSAAVGAPAGGVQGSSGGGGGSGGGLAPEAAAENLRLLHMSAASVGCSLQGVTLQGLMQGQVRDGMEVVHYI
jgi:hypothetical protein